MSFIIAIIALLLALYVGLKPTITVIKNEYKPMKYKGEHPAFKMLDDEGNVRGMYVIQLKIERILTKPKEETHVKFVFYGGRDDKVIKL